VPGLPAHEVLLLGAVETPEHPAKASKIIQPIFLIICASYGHAATMIVSLCGAHHRT
jgi:hypothetical protein